MPTKPVLASCLIVLLLAILGCGLTPPTAPIQTTVPTRMPADTSPAPGPAPDAASRIPIIFDDDGSPDGTTALLYILSHPRADVRAASISYGETHPEVYIQHVGRIMDAAGITGIPLGYGQDSPMAGNNEFPEGIRQAGNNFWGLPIPNADKTYPAQSSPQLMVSIIHQFPSPVTIFISGPATNLAQALQLDPTIKNNIAAVYMMGGAMYVRGNIDDLLNPTDNTTAEWNVYGDPLAVQIALEAGLDFRFVPLDATNLVHVTGQEVSQWRQGGPLGSQAADIYNMVLGFQGGQEALVWDVMTAAIMLEPDLCKFTPLRIEVVTRDGSTSGQTVAVPGGQPNSSACLEPDVARIQQRLLEVFSRSPAAPAIVPNPPAVPAFRDDFTGSLQPGWTWQNENPSRWSLSSDGWLEILGEDASVLSGAAQSNLLCRPASEGDVQISAHVSANPTADFQQATLFLYQDADNYIAINRGFCGPCASAGSAVFMESKTAGALTTSFAKTADTDVFLRLEVSGQTVTGSYALDADAWQSLGSAGSSLTAPSICLGVSNADKAGLSADLLGRFDYVEVAVP
jgi:purine nucleosidase/pyrimidine-specific ribonucleoside hydrolase